MKYVRGDSRTFTFVDNKCERYFLMKRNPRKIRWTQVYRKLHKKGQTEEYTRKRSRKTQKLQRAIVGASLQEIKQKRNQKPEVRAASREAALREVKERKKEKTLKKEQAKKGSAPSKTAAKTKAPKTKAPKQNIKAGTKR